MGRNDVSGHQNEAVSQIHTLLHHSHTSSHKGDARLNVIAHPQEFVLWCGTAETGTKPLGHIVLFLQGRLISWLYLAEQNQTFAILCISDFSPFLFSAMILYLIKKKKKLGFLFFS